jgi:CRISPR-associated endoribonuclease Cas6
MFEQLQHFKAGKYTFRLRALADLHLPAFKGATLRGGFGQALKQVACALKRQDCKTCLLRDRCVYLYLFETPPPADTEMMRLYPAAPHPFVIEPPLSAALIVPAGEILEFGLVLVGNALDYLPYFVYAFICLGEKGLGRSRGKFRLEDIFHFTGNESTSIYDSRDQSLRHSVPFIIREHIMNQIQEHNRTKHLSFHFLSPTRIKFNGHLVEQPEFHQIVRSLLRRISSLSYFHCGQRLDLDFRELIQQAQSVIKVLSDCHWEDWERYSSRQKNKMSLGGFVGTVCYSGNFSPFIELLCLGELVHVGKAASFGLGRYRTRTDSGAA